MNALRFTFICLASSMWTLTLRAGETPDQTNSRGGPFILGAEISWAQEDEADGAQYFDHGVRKDIFQIFKSYGFNYIRLRLFVNPASPGGYASGRSEAFCDLDHVKVLARRAKAADMKTLLDIHYGDTWTSPGKQAKPAAWRDLEFPALAKAVHDFTYQSVRDLKQNGTTPDMVQIGNEISDGMLFPDGSRGHIDQFAELVKAGIAGVHEVDPKIKIMLHHHLGRSNERMRDWIDQFLARGVEFDVIGMSCYAQAQEGDWKRNFDDLATRYPKLGLIAVEYSARKRYVNDLIFNAPDKKGLGTFIWEPTRHREALFNRNGRNAGSGQATNFTADEGINQGARLRNTNDSNRMPLGTTVAATSAMGSSNVSSSVSTNRVGTNVTASTELRRRRVGGRYDVNELMDLYPQMARAYGNIPAEKKDGHEK
jgi:arabinogalactan endo-1,4-beta-galactosidase